MKSYNPKEWTVMVYMAGDNNLSSEMVRALKDMFSLGTGDNFDCFVQLDPSAAPAAVYNIPAGSKKTIQQLSDQGEPIRSDDTGQRYFSIPRGGARNLRVLASGRLIRRQRRDLAPRPYASLAAAAMAGTHNRLGSLYLENSADPRVLKTFIEECIEKDLKAGNKRYYMLVLSGHGSGAVGDFLTDENAARSRVSSLSIPNLRLVFTQVLKDLKKKYRDRFWLPTNYIDVLGMDSCLMSMAEVAYEVREYVKYLVGAEGFIPSQGWPYHHMLGLLRDKPRIQPEDYARCLVGRYVEYYSDYESCGVSVDHAACHLGIWDIGLTAAVKRLADALTDGLEFDPIKDAIVLAHWQAQSYKYDQYTDLYDFCSVLSGRMRRAGPHSADEGTPKTIRYREHEKTINLNRACTEIADACSAVMDKMKNSKKLWCCWHGPDFQHSHGISVYFPWNHVEVEYRNMKFAKAAATGWFNFLCKYVCETRRLPRLDGVAPGQKEPKPLRLTSGYAVRNGEELSAKYGEELSAKYAPEATVRYGEELSAKYGEELSAKGQKAVKSMKNPPIYFHHPKCPCPLVP
jgi:hypothetical protein